MGSAATFYRGVRQDQIAHDQSLQDAARQQQLNQFDVVGKNIQSILAAGVDPHTQQPLTDEQKQHLSNVYQTVQTHQKSLFNPKFNPVTGEVPEDPIHRLTTALHITADTHPAPPVQQMNDLNSIIAQYGGVPEVNPLLKNARHLKEAGFSDEDVKRVLSVQSGIIPKPNTGTDFDRYLDSVAKDVGKKSRLDMTPDEITDARRAYMNAGRTSKETFVPDAESTTGFAKVGYDAGGTEIYRIKNAVPPRGVLARETTTTDPFGVTTTTTSKPVFPGTNTGKPTSSTPTTPKGKVPVSSKTAGQIVLPGASKPLDADGHIPETAGVNPMLRQAANSLLDGMDIDKLAVPQKDRAAAQHLAEQYGYKGQGTFTPKEQVMLREASTFLTQALNDPNLGVLDQGFFKQLPMIAQSQDPAKEGFFTKLLDKAASVKQTPEQAGFMRTYRQLVGTISGLSQLVRSGRATEATINRLIAELPNPYNVQNSVDAKDRIMRLQKELGVALQKGKFESDQAPPTGSEPPASSGKIVSLKAAMSLPVNQGKTEAEVRADIESHGHKVGP